MSPVHRFAALVLAALTVGGCAQTQNPPEVERPPGTPVPSATQQPADIPFGQVGEVIGDKGTRLKMTPFAVMYTKGAKDSEPPANGWFAVIAIRAETTTGLDNVPPPITGFGLYWRGEETTLDGSEGNASNTAWVGTVNEFSNAPIEPGHPETALETFDIPAKGGRLIYINPDSSITAWQLPSSDTGDQQVFKRVGQRIQEFGGGR